MKFAYLIALFAAAIAIVVVVFMLKRGGKEHFAAVPLPNGSYSKSCKNCVDVINAKTGQHTLQCSGCKDKSGKGQVSILQYKERECKDISNQNGVLTCAK